jgi:Nuclease-related domain
MTPQEKINGAIRLYKEGQCESSCHALHELLRSNPKNFDALLWLAKVAPVDREASAAAELALALEPENETAKRAVAAIQARPQKPTNAAQQIDIMRITGMTPLQARAVVWPFRRLYRPIGVLLDEGKIDAGQLLYGVQHAYDSSLKEAARTLLLTEILGDKLKESPRPLTVVEGADYSGYQVRRSTALAGLFGGVAITSFVLGLGAWVVGIILAVLKSPLNVSTFYVAILLMGLAYVIGELAGRNTRKSDQFRAGAEAESQVIDSLRACLNEPWVLVHSLEWPDRQWGDIDLLLVGPGGVFALEVKAFTSVTRIRGDRWEYKGRWGWHKMNKNPGRQATTNAVRLKNYLDQKRCPVAFVQPIVVWAGDDDLLTLDDPAVLVWRLSELADRSVVFWETQRLNEDEIRRCKEVLVKVTDTMKEKVTAEKKNGRTKKAS